MGVRLPYPIPDPSTDQWDPFALKRNLETIEANLSPVLAMGPWMVSNLASGASSSVLTLAQVTGMPDVALHRAGSIVGVSGAFNANITAGTVTAAVRVNGSTVFSATNSQTGVLVLSGAQKPGVDLVTTADSIGLEVSSTASLLPAGSLEGVFWIFVELD